MHPKRDIIRLSLLAAFASIFSLIGSLLFFREFVPITAAQAKADAERARNTFVWCVADYASAHPRAAADEVVVKAAMNACGDLRNEYKQALNDAGEDVDGKLAGADREARADAILSSTGSETPQLSRTNRDFGRAE